MYLFVYAVHVCVGICCECTCFLCANNKQYIHVRMHVSISGVGFCAWQQGAQVLSCYQLRSGMSSHNHKCVERYNTQRNDRGNSNAS